MASNMGDNSSAATEAISNTGPAVAANSSEGADGGSDFVNAGLQRWEEVRSLWLKKTEGGGMEPSRTAISIDVDEIIDIVISNRWRDAPAKSKKGGKTKIDGCSFSHPIPLPQMIDVLTDLWEAEGLEM